MSDLVRWLRDWSERDTVMSEFGPDEHIAGMAADHIEDLESQIAGYKIRLKRLDEIVLKESGKVEELQSQKELAYKEVEFQVRKRTDLQSQVDELKSCLNLTLSWADNWGSAFMEDDEWIEQDYPRIKAAIKGEK